MAFSDYQRVAFTRSGRILTATLTGTNPVNPVDGRMHHELSSDLIILTGAGDKAFCAGGDVAWFDEQIANPASFRAIAPEAKRIVTTLLDLEKPILCRLNGAAAGLGATLALLCDVVVAADTAKIGDPHVKVGLVAGDGGAVIWPALIGHARAKELLMTGEMLSAGEAQAMGLIAHVVEPAALDAKVDEITRKILANPRWAVRWTKTVINAQLKMLAAAGNDPAVAYEILSNMTADRAEAVAAFKGRRAANLSGE
jgi:enoyl-CoA hydratase